MRGKLAIVGLGAAAFAAPAAAQTASWTGFYVGLDGTGTHQGIQTSGQAFVSQVSGVNQPGRGIIIVPGTEVDFGAGAQFNVPTSQASNHKESGTFGGQAGFDWQFGGLVAGLVGDIQATRRSQTTTYATLLPFTAVTPPTTVTLQRTTRIGTEWSARARLGAALGSTLVYATGGAAGARVRLSNNDTFFDPGGPAAGCGSAPTPACLAGLGPLGPVNNGPSGPTVTQGAFNKTKIGWTAGGGLEQKIGAHLSIGLEYRHTDLGTISYAVDEAIVSPGAVITDPTGNHPSFQASVMSSTTKVRLRSDAISLRVNFRF